METIRARTALLAGASGLVGGHCLQALLASPRYDRVVSLGRRALPLEHPKLEQHAVDFRRLDQLVALPAVDDAFCCLGTTIRKAGSEAAFREVDYTFVVGFARLARANGGSRLAVVSSLGADARSRVFYARVKGEMEAAVAQLGFASVLVFRPSLLLGERQEERRVEALASLAMRALEFTLVGPLRGYRAIPGEAVARAMVAAAEAPPPGVTIYPSDAIADLAEGAPSS